MDSHVARAELLIEHLRYQEAEQELLQATAVDSQDALARSLLAVVLCKQKKLIEAIREAKKAVGLAPGSAYSHFVLALVLYETERYSQALTAIQEAIRIDSESPRHYNLLGHIYLQERDWPSALHAAEQGLRLDAEDVDLNNLRAMALVKLGRRDEAGLTLDTALAKEPENAMTHANQGWALLHQGAHKQALDHFREALRLNPTLAWARQGIVEALKARNPLYWVMLRYFLWMSRLNSKTRWGIVIGFYVLARIAHALAKSDPGLAPILNPVLYLYSAFAILTWISQPLFNLFLRLDRYGRFALSREQIVASNWVAGCLVLAGAALGAGIATGVKSWTSLALIFVALVLPVSGIWLARQGGKRITLIVYTGLLALVGLSSTFPSQTGTAWANMASALFWLGWIAFTWVANALMS